MDIIACLTPTCADGFLFDGILQAFGQPAYGSGPSYADVIEPYNPANWSLTEKATATPEPTTTMALGFLGGSLLLNKRLKQS